MSQLSRPFQLVLLVFGVLALVWLFVLQGHPANTSTSPATSVVSAPAPTASSEAKAAAAPTNVYHGAAPGVEGLTHAIAQAHKAVATSQQSAAAVEHKSAAASGSTSTNSSQGTSSATTPATHTSSHTSTAPGKGVGTATSTHAAHTVAPTSATRVHHSATPTKQTTTPKARTHASPHPGAAVPAGQRAVERQLSQGNVVALLFWNRQSPSDTAVRDELQLLLKVHQHSQSYANQPKVKRLFTDFSSGIHRTIAVDEATAKQVAEYGAITRGVQLYNTPTLLIITKTGKTLVLTGLQDAYSIEQAIDEARNA